MTHQVRPRHLPSTYLGPVLALIVPILLYTLIVTPLILVYDLNPALLISILPGIAMAALGSAMASIPIWWLLISRPRRNGALRGISVGLAVALVGHFSFGIIPTLLGVFSSDSATPVIAEIATGLQFALISLLFIGPITLPVAGFLAWTMVRLDRRVIYPQQADRENLRPGSIALTSLGQKAPSRTIAPILAAIITILAPIMIVSVFRGSLLTEVEFLLVLIPMAATTAVITHLMWSRMKMRPTGLRPYVASGINIALVSYVILPFLLVLTGGVMKFAGGGTLSSRVAASSLEQYLLLPPAISVATIFMTGWIFLPLSGIAGYILGKVDQR